MKEKLKAVIVDLDGTLANVHPVRHLVATKPKQYQEFHQYASNDAEPLPDVAEMVWDYARRDHVIIIVSGRRTRWLPDTQLWLYKYGIAYGRIYMRSDDDSRSDVMVKREFYDDIAREFDVVLAIDDRPSIVELWQSLGVPVHVVPGWHQEQLEDRVKEASRLRPTLEYLNWERAKDLAIVAGRVHNMKQRVFKDPYGRGWTWETIRTTVPVVEK